MSSPEAFRRLANCVEALREVPGVEVSDSHIDEYPADDFDPISAIFGGEDLSSDDMEEKLHIILDLTDDADKEDEQGPDWPDDEKQTDEEATPIQIEDASNVTVSNRPPEQ